MTIEAQRLSMSGMKTSEQISELAAALAAAQGAMQNAVMNRINPHFADLARLDQERAEALEDAEHIEEGE